jgi:hypothetical protein
VDQQGYEGTGESHHQDTSSRYGDQVDRPMVAGQVEVSRVLFVPVCVKVHGGLLALAPYQPAIAKVVPCRSREGSEEWRASACELLWPAVATDPDRDRAERHTQDAEGERDGKEYKRCRSS